MTYNTPEDVISAFVTGDINRLELEHILNCPHYDLDRFGYIACLLTADDLKHEGTMQ
ncbi:MAG: hypothetical protein GY807_21200 [Gammaproteobacteria bacterium]|nr:hypothetical protein [Gammaproteobacteria bacterium]